MSAVVLHKVISPYHFALIAIDSYDVTIARCHKQLVVPLGKVREVVLLVYLVGLVAVLYQGTGLLSWVVAVQSLVVGLHPEALLRVDIETVYTALNAPLIQYGCRVSRHLFGHGVKHAVVHALLQPQLALAVFPYLVYIVVSEGCRVVGIRVVYTESVTVISVQSVRCTNPDEST